MENNSDRYECDDNVNDADDGDDDVDLEKNLISPGGKPVASGSVGADVGSVGMAALILVLLVQLLAQLVLHRWPPELDNWCCTVYWGLAMATANCLSPPQTIAAAAHPTLPRATAIRKTNIGEDRQLLGLPVDKWKIT